MKQTSEEKMLKIESLRANGVRLADAVKQANFSLAGYYRNKSKRTKRSKKLEIVHLEQKQQKLICIIGSSDELLTFLKGLI